MLPPSRAASGGSLKRSRNSHAPKRRRWQTPCKTDGPEHIMRVKVQNGTVPHSEASLCTTCRHSIVTRGQTLDEEIVHCQAVTMGATRITFKVTSCSGYSDERAPSYMQFMEDAWILQPGSKKRPAGFIRARDLREEELTSVMIELRERRER
jgi:hypothetical protein